MHPDCLTGYPEIDFPTKRSITPHKGRRTIQKSTNVTWETEQKLQTLKAKDGSGLGDVIQWAVNQLIPKGDNHE